VRGARWGAGEHRQVRCGAIERLDLPLLIHAQHDRALGRVEVQPDDVVDLVDEQRVLGQLERLLAVRLQRNACQIRGTAVCVKPTSAAIERVDQRCTSSLR
jgi:hypothetical protein